MKPNKFIISIVGFSLLCSLGFNGRANEPLKLQLDLPSSLFDLSIKDEHIRDLAFTGVGSNNPLVLAQADTSDTNSANQLSVQQYQDRLFTRNKMHQYLGLGAIAAGLLSAIAPKENDGLHEDAARLSSLLAAGSVTTGFIYHWDDIGGEGGLLTDPDNIHTLLAGLGALGIVISTATAPGSGHATTGMLGLTAMLIGVKYTW